ncbi:MAG: carbohydrate kinase [Clostridia bacterium]|nr:carbohydrate kinase [Clostridia bacterium]
MNKKRYLLGIDNGGTLCKAAVFDTDGRQIIKKEIRIPLTVNENGRTERDPHEIIEKNFTLIREITAELDGEIAAVGLSGHGKGLYLLDKEGKPLGNGIGSTDSRALSYELEAAENGLSDEVYPYTYQKILACQPVCLLRWLKEHDRDTYDRIGAILSVKDLVGYALTDVIAAELTDMSGTNLLSLASGGYDPKLTELFGISEINSALPELISSFALRGYVTEEASRATGLPAGIPVSGGMFDIDACALGAGTFAEGDLCIIAGTWSINEYITGTPVRAAAMNSFWCVDGYYLAEESSAASAGNLEWMRDILKDRSYKELDALAEAVSPEKSAAVFLPFLYASNLDPLAKASLVGLESGYGEGEVILAIYEGVVFSGYTHLERLLNSMETPPSRLKLAGGVVNSPFWTQMFADVAGIPVETAEKTELGCKGAAMSAGIAAGIYSDAKEAVSACVKPGNPVEPNTALTPIYRKKYEIYRKTEETLRPVWKAMKDFRKN